MGALVLAFGADVGNIAGEEDEIGLEPVDQLDRIRHPLPLIFVSRLTVRELHYAKRVCRFGAISQSGWSVSPATNSSRLVFFPLFGPGCTSGGGQVQKTPPTRGVWSNTCHIRAGRGLSSRPATNAGRRVQSLNCVWCFSWYNHGL